MQSFQPDANLLRLQIEISQGIYPRLFLRLLFFAWIVNRRSLTDHYSWFIESFNRIRYCRI